MKFLLILACASTLSFSAMAADKLTEAKNVVALAITNSFTIIDSKTLDTFEVSSETVDINSIDCGEDKDILNSICVVTATEETEAKDKVRGYYFIVDSDSSLIKHFGPIPTEN